MSQIQNSKSSLTKQPRTLTVSFLWLGVSCLVLLIAGGWALTAAVNNSQRQEDERINRYQEILRWTNLLYQGALDAETGIRGYLITRDPQSLAPYYEGQANFAKNLALLRQVEALKQSERLGQIERSFEAWQNRFGRPVLKSFGNSAEIERLAQTSLAGKAVFDSLRLDIEAFLGEQRARLITQQAVARKTRDLIWLVNNICTCLVMLGVLLLGLWLHRSLQQLLQVLDERTQTLTALQQSQKATQAALNRLEKANTELDSFVYSASHDLREPLRSLEAFSGFLLEDLGPRLEGQEADYLNRIVNATQRMRRLLEDLLQLSRIGRDPEQHSSVDLNWVLREVLLEFELQIQERHAKLRCPEVLPTVTGNATELASIFRNLIGNALKFSPGPYGEEGGPQVEISYAEQQHEFLFWVRDWGIGVDPNYHDRIFVLFQRLGRREEFEGTGAGLAIVRKGVLAHGGQVWVESQPNEGSCFFFTIPKNPKL
ncbi:ATP-binding protein [Leptolyngbya sp. FACHB-261]|uniref:sensor histidine kinase n=1 Tax=Leptolyngbya sp. FACHB-261 TaxID=2692806 RepID=UPI001688CCFD|nr:sensor histidine kinase [Leptolyngbya sp. FACHB-261]MBD2102285.1 CHASE3 domain-containing protein [Leptolyngbya sp. FACHB-261]